MYRILALDPWHGWAYISEGRADGDQQVSLIRPPYRDADRVGAGAPSVEQALAEGFRQGPDLTFDNLGQLISHLDVQAVSTGHAPTAVSLEQLADAWDTLPRDLLTRAVDDLAEQIEDADPRRSSRYLALVLARPAVQADPALITALAGLLLRVLDQFGSALRPATEAREVVLQAAGPRAGRLRDFLDDAEGRRSLFRMDA